MAQNVNLNDHDWKELPSQVSVTLPSESWDKRHSTMCSYYIDINGKEWIVILLPTAWLGIAVDPSQFSSYLYDVEKDKFVPFIKNYRQDINIKFNISHALPVSDARGQSFVIDNDNHILYWLESATWQISLLALDIKNLKDIKFIDQTFLPSKIDGVIFCKTDYTMLFAGDTIQFVLGQHESEPGNSITNFQYDIKTKKTSLVHKNIHLKSIDHVAKILKLDELKIGDYIDVKDKLGKWYLAKILEIKDKQLDNSECCSMQIFVHFVGWSKRWDEWVYVTKNINANVDRKTQLDELKSELKQIQVNFVGIFHIGKIDIDDIIDQLENGTSICNCNQECIYNDIASKMTKFYQMVEKEFLGCHVIALPKSQSLYNKSLRGLHGLYSNNTQTMIMVGQNGEKGKELTFGGIYCKRMSYNHDEKYFDIVVNGFIQKELKQFKQLYIPQDVCQLILKYFFIPNDKEWKYMTKRDENDMVIYSQNDETFHRRSRYVIVDNGNNYNYQATLTDYDDHDQVDVQQNGSCDNDIQHITIYKFGSYYNGTSLIHVGEKFDTISRLDINMKTNSYKIRRLTSIKCPKSYDDNKYWHAVFCQKSQTIHLFEQKFKKHYFIKLEKLQNAKTVAS